MHTSFALALSLTVVSPLLPRGAAAQVVRGELAVAAGVATDQRGLRSNAVTVAPAVLLTPDPHFSASLGLSGTQFASNVRALTGTGSAGARLPLGAALALAASASGSATQTTFSATYRSADFTPTVEATLARLTVFAGARAANGTTSLTLARQSPASGVLGAPVAALRDTTISRTSVGPVFGGVYNYAGAVAGDGGSIAYREERARVDRVAVTDRMVMGTVANGAFTLAASGGVRDAEDEHAGFGSVSATVRMSHSFALQGAAGTYPSNRVTGSLGGRFVSLGLMIYGIRRMDSEPAGAIQVRGAPAVPSGATRLAIVAPTAKRVEVAGDWNEWVPVTATRHRDGTWYADVRLPRGEYRYAFRIDGQKWDVPDGVPSMDDGFGGRSALITVR